jgi:hypothetical protein
LLLDPDKLKEQYDDAHTAMRPLWENFDEYERIARNKPHPRVIEAKLPTVTDGTLASVIAAQPKRVIQQIPTGRLTSLAKPDLAKIADYIWINDVLRYANYNGTPLQKSWIMTRKALTYGSQVSYGFFRNSGSHFGADFSIPYMRDLILEAGKTYGPDCDVLYLRQWYTKAQIQLLIDRETKLGKSAKSRKEQYDGSWDVPMLKKLLETTRQKDADAATPVEREKGLINKFVEVIHCFQTGVSAPFYSFAPDLAVKDMKTNGVIRTRNNKDPRGKMPLSFMYADIDLSSPLGVGYPEMSGGMQNLLDSEVQSYQLQQKIGLNPPIMVWGAGVKRASLKYKPNAIWDMGSDPSAKAEPVNINTEAITNFATNYGMIKGQILNMHPNQASSVSAETGNSQSKTAQGVNQQDQTVGFEDNYVRKQFEEWWEANAETMLNLHFAESNGVAEIELTEDFIENILPDIQPGKAVSFNVAKHQATIDYALIKEKFTFTVDPTTSESPDDADQLEKLKSLLSEAQSAPYLYYYLLNDGYQLKLGEAYKQAFQLAGLTDIDKIVVELPKDQQGPSEEQLRGVLNPLYDKPTVSMAYQDLPPAAQVQALANAGITITVEDALMGPVLDQNIRGVDVPQVIPNPEMPTPAGGMPTQPGTVGPTSAMQPTTQVQTSMAQPPAPPVPGAAPVVQHQPAPQPMPQAQPGPQQPMQPQVPPNFVAQMSPEERNLLQEFLKAGYSAKQALKALALAKKGLTTTQITSELGTPDHSSQGVAPMGAI